jgi:predicted membrane-bound mannosyltransferase
MVDPTRMPLSEITAESEAEPRPPGNLVVEAGRRAAATWRRRADATAHFAKWEIVAYGLLLATALGMRLWDLGARAMHHDESLHALYSFQLSIGDGYTHNPMMHGPFQMEATAGIFFLLGDGEFTARLLYAIAGTALAAMPLLLRSRLGTMGALITSIMLAFSPAMLYFSRFARNDILMAVWTLGLVIAMWRYIDEGKSRYLYAGAAILALAFATKESAYVVTAILGGYLFLGMVIPLWPTVSKGVEVGNTSVPGAIGSLSAGAWTTTRRLLGLNRISRPARFFMLLFTLSLPLGAALASIFQDTALLSWSNLVLAQPADKVDIGAPVGGGLVVAAIVVGALIWVSAVAGTKWLGRAWWLYGAIFMGTLVLLYSTFFTNPSGIGSGIWQSLGYWLAQQDVARGGQPIYYYLIITPVYEFLPLVFGIAGGIYYVRRRDRFGLFLVFWAVTTFVIYTYISEKMPWLLINLTMPLIVLSGKFLGEVISGIEWRRVASGGGWLVIPSVPAFMVAVWSMVYFSNDGAEASDVVRLLIWTAVAIGTVVIGYVLAKRLGTRAFWSFAAVPLAIVLLALTARAGWMASFQNGDVPVEMLVYTQTSPDLASLVNYVEGVGESNGDRGGTPIQIDGTNGFSWPWAWYLRNFSNASYINYDGPIESPPETSVLVVHANNKIAEDASLDGLFSEGVRIPHRRWFPENYRGLTVGKFINGLVDAESRRNVMDYFLLRELDTPLGSEDAVVYFAEDLPPGFTPSK